MKLDGCNALITGASAGIGREFARQLASRARSMILVARRDERLIELADELQREHPKLVVHIRKVDLGDLVHLQAFLESLDREKLGVDLLINNAGLGDSGPFAKSDPVRNEEMTVVNVAALTLLTRHFVPQMIAKRRGGILNVSSSAGFLPIPGFAVYAATKAYVTSFSEALRAELRETGVTRMRALSRSCGNRIPASRQTGGSAAGHRSELPCCYSRRGRARCARGTRSRSAARDSGVRDETVDASRSIDAVTRFAMGRADVAEENMWRRVATGVAPRRWHAYASDETSCAGSRTPGE